MKEIPFKFLGLELTLFTRHLSFAAKDFHIDEEVLIKADVGSFIGLVTGIADYGVTIRLVRHA